MFEIIGTIVFNELEGGFWGILSDDGKKYCPDELPQAFQRPGLRVRTELERSSGFSLRMWGIDVLIRYMESLGE